MRYILSSFIIITCLAILHYMHQPAAVDAQGPPWMQATITSLEATATILLEENQTLLEENQTLLEENQTLNDTANITTTAYLDTITTQQRMQTNTMVFGLVFFIGLTTIAMVRRR